MPGTLAAAAVQGASVRRNDGVELPCFGQALKAAVDGREPHALAVPLEAGMQVLGRAKLIRLDKRGDDGRLLPSGPRSGGLCHALPSGAPCDKLMIMGIIVNKVQPSIRSTRRPSIVKVAAVGLVSGTLLLAACSSGDEESTVQGSARTDAASLSVSANFYPIQWLVREIGGPAVSVTGLTPVGEEPHDLVLNAKSRQAMQDSDVVFYLGSDFQPDVEKAVAQLAADTTTVDLLSSPGVTLLAAPADLGKESLKGNKDPHVWLDPTQMIAMADQIADVLTEADPQQAEVFAANRNALVARLTALDEELTADLTDCRVTTIVTSHAAFNYLAQRYGLEQLAIAGVSPDDQPDPATLQSIAEGAQAAGVTTVFFEEQLPRDLSETVASEIGASVDLLSALEFDPEEATAPGEDYVSVMQDNGKRLATGLQCQ